MFSVSGVWGRWRLSTSAFSPAASSSEGAGSTPRRRFHAGRQWPPLVVADPHSEAGRPAGNLLTDRAEPDEPEHQPVEDEGVLPAQPVEGEEALGGDGRFETAFPVSPGAHSLVAFHDAARHREEQSERVVGDRDGAGVGDGVHRHPAAAGRPQAHRDRIPAERDHERRLGGIQLPASDRPFPGNQDVGVPNRGLDGRRCVAVGDPEVEPGERLGRHLVDEVGGPFGEGDREVGRGGWSGRHSVRAPQRSDRPRNPRAARCPPPGPPGGR